MIPTAKVIAKRMSLNQKWNEENLEDWRRRIEEAQREVLEDCRETIAYCRQYFVNTGLSALRDCDGSLKLIDDMLNAGKEEER